jgi:S1-C subfamily serine protease
VLRGLITLAVAYAVAAPLPPARAASVDELVQSLVQVKTFINPEGRTAATLGREREGTGVVIDTSGLILTIGYIMVEAHAAELVTSDGRTITAEIVGYDHETGFGVLRANTALKVPAMPLGQSAAVAVDERVVVASFGGTDMLLPARIAARREFAGNWEYLLDDAIFTSPPHPKWAGAALISRDGKLLGIGSLLVGDASGKGEGNLGNVPGNMFVPIDRLPPILAELIAEGRVSSAAKPWLGLAVDEASGGRLIVTRVTPEGPAAKAGIKRGSLIAGVSGKPPRSLADFYRKVWALGSAGATVPIEILQDGETKTVTIKSMNRMDHLKLRSTF